jgi:hypothetical protein
MKHAPTSATVVLLSSLAIAACNAPAPIASEPTAVQNTQVPVPTEVLARTATATREASPTPTPPPIALEVVEWSTWSEVPGYTNIAVLLRNPNDFPVRVRRMEASVTSSDAVERKAEGLRFDLWENEGWGLILPGQSIPADMYVSPIHEGEAPPEWHAINLVTDLEQAIAPPYTLDLDVSVGEFRSSLEFDIGADVDITNTSGQTLKAVLLTMMARSANGVYLGVDTRTTVGSWDEAGNLMEIEPGQAIHFVHIPTLTRVPPESIHYEITAIGLLAQE